MALITQGFGGTKRGLFVTGASRNIIIRLRCPAQDAQHRIRGIYYSYGLYSGNTATFVQGRIAIVLGILDNDQEAAAVPDALEALDNAIFDHTLNLKNDMINFGPDGLLIPKGSDASVVLMAPNTSGDVQPVFDSMIGALTILGQTEGLKNAFEKLR